MDLEIRKAQKQDWEFIRQLRNSSSEGFFSPNEITQEEHLEFMEKNFHNYLIASEISTDMGGTQETLIGFIGHVKGDVRLAVAPNFRKMGVGKRMLKAMNDNFPEQKFRAQVKITNPASINTFLSLGWKKLDGISRDEKMNFKFITLEK